MKDLQVTDDQTNSEFPQKDRSSKSTEHINMQNFEKSSAESTEEPKTSKLSHRDTASGSKQQLYRTNQSVTPLTEREYVNEMDEDSVGHDTVRLDELEGYLHAAINSYEMTEKFTVSVRIHDWMTRSH